MTFDATRTFAIDLAERAGKTFLQAAVPVAGAALVAAGPADAVSLAWWQQAAVTVGLAGGAAVLSLLTNLFAGLRTGTGSLSTKVAQTAVVPGAHAADGAPRPAVVAPIYYSDPAAPLDGLPPVEIPVGAA